MRVGINATSLNDRASGAKQRFIGLYGALFRANPNIEYIVYEPRDCRIADWFMGLPNVRGIATPMPSVARWGRFIRGLGYWRRRFRRDRLSLFETLHLPLLRAADCPTMLTVHDARPILASVRPFRRALNLLVLRRALRQADRVVTVSRAIRSDLLAVEPRALIDVIPNGVDPSPFHAASEPRVAPLEGRFLLAVGHFEPRKNYPALVAAMNLVRRDDPALKLAIVGRDGGTLADTAALVERLGLGDHVRLLHDVDDAGLASLYRKALMLVFPSTYEGFGIPILEAMAAGTPMALSDIPVFRELTEDRCAYFDPWDPMSMAKCIADLMSSAEQQAAQRRYGASRIADFDFSRLAASLASLHREVIDEVAGTRPSA